jgi:hypothetical protein
MKSKLCIALLWVFIFLLGGIAGAVGYHLYRSYSPPTREDFLNKLRKDLKKDLKLDEKQTDSIMALFKERFERKQALINELQPRLDAIRTEYNEKIRSILSPEQRLLFEAKLQRLQKSGIQPHPIPPTPPHHER